MVGRYLQNYGKENNVGLMLTHRLDETLSGMPSSNNTTLSIDGLIRPKNELTISYMLSGSRDNSADTVGLAGRIFASYRTNKMYLGWLTNFVTENYNPDMGFVFQKDVVWHNPGGYFIWRPKNIPWIRRFDPGAFFNYYHDASDPDNFQQANFYLFPIFVFFRDGSFFEYAIFPTWQNINFRFAPLGVNIALGDYYYTRHRLTYRTDQSSKLSFTTSYDWGDFYNGNLSTLKGGIRYAPLPQVAFRIDYERNYLNALGELQQTFDTHLTSAGARFAINPRLQLSAFYQYNTVDEQGRLNVRASWEYKPLSFIYFVFNDSRIDTFERRFDEQQLIGKITFLKQF